MTIKTPSQGSLRANALRGHGARRGWAIEVATDQTVRFGLLTERRGVERDALASRGCPEIVATHEAGAEWSPRAAGLAEGAEARLKRGQRIASRGGGPRTSTSAARAARWRRATLPHGTGASGTSGVGVGVTRAAAAHDAQENRREGRAPNHTPALHARDISLSGPGCQLNADGVTERRRIAWPQRSSRTSNRGWFRRSHRTTRHRAGRTGSRVAVRDRSRVGSRYRTVSPRRGPCRRC